MGPHPTAFWLLDLDGTVVDVADGYIQSVLTDVGDRLGCAFTATEARQLWYGDADARGSIFESRACDRAEFWREYHAVEDPHARAEATYVYPDAAAFVTALDAPVGLVTHCQSYLTEPILETLDIADWFETVVCCSDDTGWKPDPGPVELAMANLGVSDATNGALAGDGPADVEAARNAGLEAIHVDRRRDAVAGPTPTGDRTVRTLTDLTA